MPFERGGNEFLDRLKLTVAEYDRVLSLNLKSFLRLISVREIVWSHLREVCPTFRPMNCDTVFSEMVFATQSFLATEIVKVFQPSNLHILES